MAKNKHSFFQKQCHIWTGQGRQEKLQTGYWKKRRKKMIDKYQMFKAKDIEIKKLEFVVMT